MQCLCCKPSLPSEVKGGRGRRSCNGQVGEGLAKPPPDRRSDLATARYRLGEAAGGRVSSKVRPRMASKLGDGGGRQPRYLGKADGGK